MADRALRGMTIGAKSMESEDGVEFAERMMVTYECPVAHVTTIPMSTEAEVPASWECPECGRPAARRGEDEESDSEDPRKIPRTHWDMLLERRGVEELQALLDERLEMLRSGAVYRERL
ncbi:RNA polymerase-binding protein RbpA [Actinomyces sp. 2119]|uniref:RNA polymerase-binding protein RbpA n=1 Tax=Actinomyces lilanjuaniae TaxID=2321394 RepID=A0ABM6Z397_9ACTO|nr:MULTISPECIES: RNA polymerase-binding protein RbpA [Actinomyces]AYD89793.1 RNA polymerase-binding protein RbpA [Actinomyces lilanjuaniae]RJF44768.1 RNA polymerase-binding protein RbpA [Actinomyces sp. 2119]